MSPRGKKKTTTAKLMRESRLRERRLEKQVKKEARRQTAAVEATHPEPAPPSGHEEVGSETDG